MKYFNQASIIFFIYFLGIIINNKLVNFIPATIIGMLILLLLFIFKIISINKMKDFSNFMLKNLSFFFIPSGVSLLKIWPLLKTIFIKIVFISITTTILTMIVTGLSIDLLIKGCEKNNKTSKS